MTSVKLAREGGQAVTSSCHQRHLRLPRGAAGGKRRIHENQESVSSAEPRVTNSHVVGSPPGQLPHAALVRPCPVCGSVALGSPFPQVSQMGQSLGPRNWGHPC